MKQWEKIILLALFATFLFTGVVSAVSQKTFTEKLIRLHVIGADDSEEAQRLKLDVRDFLLQESEKWDASTVEEAACLIQQEIPRLTERVSSVLRQNGNDTQVTMTLDWEHLPEKNYETFSLPEGRYLTLKVVLGEGAGKNWWCVLFPPLCTAGASAIYEEQDQGELSERDWKIISGQEEVSYGFQLGEWTEKLLSFFGIS